MIETSTDKIIVYNKKVFTYYVLYSIIIHGTTLGAGLLWYYSYNINYADGLFLHFIIISVFGVCM